MTEKLGVLLVDVPEPKYWKYTFITRPGDALFSTWESHTANNLAETAYKCTKEEAKKYPQFRWVALEEL